MTINNKRLSLTQAALQVGARCGVVCRSWRKIAFLIMQKMLVFAWLNMQLLQIIALFIVQFVLSSYICDEIQLYEIWKTYLRHPVS